MNKNKIEISLGFQTNLNNYIVLAYVPTEIKPKSVRFITVPELPFLIDLNFTHDINYNNMIGYQNMTLYNFKITKNQIETLKWNNVILKLIITDANEDNFISNELNLKKYGELI